MRLRHQRGNRADTHTITKDIDMQNIPINSRQILPVPHQYGAEDAGGETDDKPFHPGAVVERGAIQYLQNNNQRMLRGQDVQAHQDLSLP